MSFKNRKNKILFGNCYRDFPEFYDLLYRRYFKSVPAFVKLVANNTPAGGKILDLAAGTGEVSISLLKQGFQVFSFDQAKGMLNQLKIKARAKKIKNAKTILGDINSMNFKSKFDTACIRQAINYYDGPAVLTKGLKLICRALKNGGKFVFNAPNFDSQTRNYPAVPNLYDDGVFKAFVLETNKMTGRRLLHRQDSIVWGGKLKEPIRIFDTNRFYMFTKPEFEKALKQAGFSKIEFYSSNLSQYDKKDKTLYYVAQK